jgi:hypothetical protein
MAIKIQGTIVLDDNRSIINANSATFTGTGFVKLPSGTVDQRPSGVDGMIRFNSESNSFEGYKNSAWSVLGAGGGVTAVSYFTSAG